jgi:hypothetical protein
LLAALLPLHKWAEEWAKSAATDLPPASRSSRKRRSARR